ncbi:hypothetical protein [Pedobacter sp.]|uniref:hypothetical protein n=1 Tax=Pedobacter sp. TaxID=1411316 RepID=UPI003BAB7FAD
MKYFFFLVFLICVQKSNAKDPKDLIGSYSGILQETGFDGDFTAKFVIRVSSVEERKINFELLIFDLPNSRPEIRRQLSGTYTRYSGYDAFRFSFDELVLSNKKKVKGTVFVAKYSQSGRDALSGYFTPDDTRDFQGTLEFVTPADSSAVTNVVEKIKDNKPTQNTQTLVEEDKLSEGAALLFKGTNSAISVAQKNKIFKDSEFAVAKDKNSFTISALPDEPFQVHMYILDLNNDGKEEVFLLYGNAAVSGRAGSSVMFFANPGKVRSRNNEYTMVFDQEGMLPNVLDDQPTFFIPGPGFSYTQFYFFRFWTLLVPIGDADVKTKAFVNVAELAETYRLSGSAGVSQRIAKLKAEQLNKDNQLIQEAKDVVNRKKALLQGKPAKFLGIFREFANYDNSVTITREGNFYILKPKTQSKSKKSQKFSYNQKLDRLEGWVDGKDIKIKVLIDYNYDRDGIWFHSGAGGFPLSFRKYNK